MPILVQIGPVVLEKKIFWISSMYFSYFVIISPLKRVGPFIWTNLSPHHPRWLCAKLSWNWPNGSGENFWISSMHFRYFVIISPWKRVGPIIWKHLNPLYPRMLCAKFDWNWPSGSEEENANVKSLRQRRRQRQRRTDFDQKSSLEPSA